MKQLLLSIIFFQYLTSSSFSQATISGRVYNDVSNIGVFDTGEELGNISVWLLDLNAVAPYYRVSPVQTATTGASGIYTFTNVAAGNFQVRVMQSTIPPTVTRAISDNDAYPNGLTYMNGVNGTNSYANIDFGFGSTAIAPSFTSQRNFQWNATNTFISETSKIFSLTPEIIGGNPVNPTITWSTDRTNAPGGAYGTNTYPQASYGPAVLGQGYPGNNKGGIHPGDNTFQLIFGGAGYTPLNNDRQTTTIQFSVPVIDTRFSIYDVDHADPQRASGRIDHVKVTGYNGAVPVMPVLANPSAAPWNTVSGNTVYGFADYPLANYSVPFNSQNEDHATVNVYFQTTIDKIEIEYEEWAPVMLSGKGISDATPPNTATNEAVWVDRSGANAPTSRGFSIGSIDYTVDAGTILPLILREFQATVTNCIVALNWETTFEENLDYFAIEYSADGREFKTIGKVIPENSINGGKYMYSVPADIISGYYRLMIKETDGKIQYSKIRSINSRCNDKVSWSFVSNPVNAGKEIAISLSVADRSIKDATIMAWDLNGRKLLQHHVDLQTGQNRFTLKTNYLNAGTYFVGIFDLSGNIAGAAQKLIVK